MKGLCTMALIGGLLVAPVSAQDQAAQDFGEYLYPYGYDFGDNGPLICSYKDSIQLYYSGQKVSGRYA